MSPGAQVPRDVSLACFLRHENESGTGQQRPPTPPGWGRSLGPGSHTGARASSSAPPAPQPCLQQPPLHEPRAAEARPARQDPARGLGAAGEATSGRAGAVFVSRSPLTVGSRSSAPQTPSAQESGPWRVWALGQTTPAAGHRGGGCPRQPDDTRGPGGGPGGRGPPAPSSLLRHSRLLSVQPCPSATCRPPHHAPQSWLRPQPGLGLPTSPGFCPRPCRPLVPLPAPCRAPLGSGPRRAPGGRPLVGRVPGARPAPPPSGASPCAVCGPRIWGTDLTSGSGEGEGCLSPVVL